MDGGGGSNKLITRPGAAVEATDGRLGAVDQVVVRPQTGELSYLVVRRGWTNELFVVPAEVVRDVAPSGTVHLTVTKEQARTQTANVPKDTLGTTGYGREVRVPLYEEELIPEKRWVDLGELRIHKFVDSREELIREAVTRDDLLVERVPVNQPLEAPVDTRVEDDWLVIPIMEEVLVVQKRLMLKEEIRIRKRQVTETQELHETVRSERAELEDATVHGVKGLDEAQAALQAPQSAPTPEDAPAITAPGNVPPLPAISRPLPEQPPVPNAPDAAHLPSAVVPPPAVAPDDETKPVHVAPRQRSRPAAPTRRRTPPDEPDDVTHPIVADASDAGRRPDHEAR